jgi:hypothetical protein
MDEFRSSEAGNSLLFPYEGGSFMGTLKYYEIWNGEIVQDPVLINVPVDTNLEVDPLLDSLTWVSVTINKRASVLVRVTLS